MDLVPALERLLPVQFTFSKEQGSEVAGNIVLENGEQEMRLSGEGSNTSLAIPRCSARSRAGEFIDIEVRFADGINVPYPFRGRILRTKVAEEPAVLLLKGNETALASSERGPVWSRSDEGGVKRFRSSFALPIIPADGSLGDALNGERFLELLPLLHWLREICESTRYEGPALRACFVFDDPNLHWPTYGYVDFEQIAGRATKENYHVSFATIPLDTWFTHQRTAAVFRRNAGRLSLAVHGNNHTKKELAGDTTQPARISLLRQAIRRIERLERSAGVQVSRVMVPPHGACSEEMLAELPGCGFEAATISHGSLRAHNKTKAWTRNLGCLPSELIQGCPVLPRWGLTGNTRNTILLAAYLEQPIILRGHHQDLKDGVELLDQLAGFINGLGHVLWSNLAGLSRASFQWRMEGNTFRVKPLSRKVVFESPKAATELIVESGSNSDRGSWKISFVSGTTVTVCAEERIPLPGSFDGAISIEATTPSVLVERPANPAVAGAFLRRLLTESRDRLLS